MKFKEGDTVVDVNGRTGIITKCWFWKHSGFELYKVKPLNPKIGIFYESPNFLILVESITEKK